MRFRHAQLWLTISRKILGLLGILTVLQGGLAPHAQAIPDYLEAWKKRYGITAVSEATCLTCHTMPKGFVLNAYGKGLRKIGVTNEMFGKTESLDSDKDGFSNIEEIRSGTNPGDAKSAPRNKPPVTRAPSAGKKP